MTYRTTAQETLDHERNLSPLQRRHARQSEIPAAFAEATLAAATAEARTAPQKKARAKANQQVWRLIVRGELAKKEGE